jgi:hypothetical protein
VATPHNDYVLIVFDSCRFDTFIAAKSKIMRKLAKPEKRWSYASWTLPSHFNRLTRLLPHASSKNVYASEYYRRDFLRFKNVWAAKASASNRWCRACICRPSQTLGYKTHARVSLPVPNPATTLNDGFDTYKLMDSHNHFRAILREVHFSEQHPSFYLLKVGETHYPYALAGDPRDTWPNLNGVHGVFKHLDHHTVGGRIRRTTFNASKLKELQTVRYLPPAFRFRQRRTLRYRTRNTYTTITSNHGELFGEDGYFGHGPIHHPKVFAVPFLEGKIR